MCSPGGDATRREEGGAKFGLGRFDEHRDEVFMVLEVLEESTVGACGGKDWVGVAMGGRVDVKQIKDMAFRPVFC